MRNFSGPLLSCALAALVLSAAAGAACAKVGHMSVAPQDPLPPRAGQTGYIGVGGRTRIPYGWKDFCNRRPEECKVPELQPVNIVLDESTWASLNQVNRYANSFITPVSNLDHWGTLLDHWDYPVDGKGDCKVYALYKRKLLMDLGFPRQSLLMTIVRDLQGEGHTILTVTTDRGDFILDNLSGSIRRWDKTGYDYIMRQSQSDPNVWMSIGPPELSTATGMQASASP